MSDLVCVGVQGGTVYLYDKTDMTLENTSDLNVLSYIEIGNSIGCLKIEHGILSVSRNRVLTVGVYLGNTYVAEVKNGTVYYYENDIKYVMFLFKQDFESGSSVCVMLKDSGFIFQKHVNDVGVCCFVPLKDGLYLSIDGDLVYKVSGLQGYSGKEYSTKMRMKELVLCRN